MQSIHRRPRHGGRRVGGAIVVAVALAACGPGPSGVPSGSSDASPGPSATAAPPSPSVGPSPFPTGGAAGRIAYVRFEPGIGRYFVDSVLPDGSDAHEIMHGHDAHHLVTRWSHDTFQVSVASLSNQEGFVTVLSPSGHTHVPSPDTSLNLVCSAWSPDGQRLACEGWSPTKTGREGIYLVDPDGTDLQRISRPTDGIHDIPGDYSPDGTKLLFVRATYPPGELGQLWTCDPDGANPKKITDTLSGYRVAWSHDGRYIAGDSGGSLLIFDLKSLGTDPVRITIPNGEASQARWSPDDSHLVFQMVRKGSTIPHIYTVAVDGSDLVQITDGPHRDEFPDWGTPGF